MVSDTEITKLLPFVISTSQRCRYQTMHTYNRFKLDREGNISSLLVFPRTLEIVDHVVDIQKEFN